MAQKDGGKKQENFFLDSLVVHFFFYVLTDY